MLKITNILKNISFSFFLLVLFAAVVFAQNPVKQGNKLFKEKKYCESIKQYDQYLKFYTNKNVFLKRGISNYHCNNLDNAIEDLNNAALLGSYDDDLYLYLAKSYQDKQDFENAILYYKKYLSYIGKNKLKRKSIITKIKRCANGLELQYKKPGHFIENWGIEINTPEDDILPLQNPDSTTIFYFSSNSDDYVSSRYYKVYQTEYSNGNWKKPQNILDTLITKNTIFLDFIEKGNSVIYFSGKNFNKGNLMIANNPFLNKEAKYSEEFNLPLSLRTGFKYIQVVNDSTIIFSSNKFGGYGGYDLFITGIRNNKWFSPINLGSKINTSYNEISPFITKDGLTLYFSSDNMNSVGGFDIFKSNFSYSENNWTDPVNIGFPANSSANDYGFRLLSSGKGGIYNSNRKDKGSGKNDIYWIYFKDQIEITDTYKYEIPFLRNRIPDLVYKDNPGNIDSSSNVIPNITSNEGTKDTDKEDFIIPNIFIKNNTYSDNDKTINFVNKLAKLMIQYPEIKVKFIGNSFNWNKKDTDLLTSIKIVENIADSLQLRMISSDRIIIKGAGDNIPAATPNGPLRSKNIITKVNNRIDISILNADTLPYFFKNERLYISKSLEDPAHILYKTVVDGLTYRIEINESDSLFLNKIQNNFLDASIEKDLKTNKYRYTVGLYKEYSSAKQLYNKLSKENFKNIKIIPYINDVQISGNEVLKYAKQYLDLVNYLEDNNKHWNYGNK